MNNLKDLVQYCAENIVDWDLKSELAVRMIGRHMPIDPGLCDEIERCAEECGYELDENGAEDVVLWCE